MDRTIEEMTKTERRKVLASVGNFTIGNSVYQAQGQCQLPPKCSLGMHRLGVLLAALNWGEPWHSELTQILPCGSWKENKAESDSKQILMGEIGWKVRGLQPAVWARPLEFTMKAVLVTVPNMSLVKRDFLSSCPCKEREGLWTSAHRGTCLMVTLSVLWTWSNCKLSIYKWSLLNPILHEC